MMKWLLLHTPQWLMNAMLRVLVLLPPSLEIKIFVILASAMDKMNNDELAQVMGTIVNAIFNFPRKEQGYRFAQIRVAGLALIPEEKAIRLVRFMAPFCQSGPLDKYATEQTNVQRAVLNAPREVKEAAMRVFPKAGATGFLPTQLNSTKVGRKRQAVPRNERSKKRG